MEEIFDRYALESLSNRLIARLWPLWKAAPAASGRVTS
jgi:hypothetical protein